MGVNLHLSIIFFLLGCGSNVSYALEKYRDRTEKVFIHYFLPLAMLFLVSLKEVNMGAALGYSGVYYFLALAFMISVNVFFKRQKVVEQGEALSMAFSASFSNLVLVGVPLFLWLDESRLISLIYMIIPLHSIVLFLFASLMKAAQNQGNQQCWSIQSIPFLSWAMLVGVVLSQLHVWDGVDMENAKSYIVNTLQLGSIWVLSSRLTRGKFDCNCFKSAVSMTLAKTILMPAFFFIALVPFSFSMAAQMAMLAGLPIGLNTMGFTVGASHDMKQSLSLALVISTVLSLLFIPIMFYCFQL